MGEKEKKNTDVKLRRQLIRSAAAIICTFAVSTSFVNCAEKISSAKVDEANISSNKVKTADGTYASSETDGTGETVVMYDENGEAYVVDADTVSESGEAVEGGTASSSASNSSGTAKTEEKYTGPLLKHGVKPFDFSKHDADPSKWSMQEIVDCYKAGMARADVDGVATDQEFQLVGDLPGATSALKSPINLAMKLGAQPYQALTGGYWDLEVSDLKKADAHKEGKYVVINLYPKEQVDGPNGDEHKGSVGHVANVVQGIGDFIAYVEENYAALNAYYEDDSIVLKYPNAYAKNVKINMTTGTMESGTWGYDVEVYLDHCGLLGIEFKDFHTTIRWKCWYPVVG